MATDTLCPEVDIDLSRVDLDVEIINPDLIIQAGIIASSGPTGPPGPQGIQGVPGIQGPPGQPLTAKGTVASSSNLPTTGNNLSDMWVTADTGHAWVWNGTSWVDMGPFEGPIGPTGPAGATGNPGSAATIAVGTTTTGAPGSAASVTNTGSSSAAVFAFTVPQGPVGTTGATGATGPQGATGAAGAAGPQGAQGPTGPQGPPGGASANSTLTSTFTMPASLATGVASVANAAAFGVGAVVYIQGLGYLSVTAVNTGANQLTLQNLGYSVNSAPGSTAPATTAVTGSGPMGPTGPTGPQGPAGATGAQGPIGNTGPTGATGAQGAQGIQGAQGATGQGYTWRGSWSNSVAYNAYDTVSYQGSSYVCVSPNTGQLPTNATYWNLIAQIGATGATGAIGATGATGSQGPQGPPGTTGATGPQGIQGDPGATGAAGPQGPPGPSTPSANAGNLLAPGSDSLLYLPASAIQPTIWSARLRSFNSVGNPNFEVDQRNVGNLISPTLGVFALDRWAVTKVGTMVMATQQSPVPITGGFVVPGTNFRISNNFLAVTLTTQEASLAAGDVWAITQNIEGPLLREIVGDVSSVSLLVACTVAGLKFSVAIRDPGTTTKSLVKLFTIPNASTWTLIQLPNLPQFPSGNFSITPGTAGYLISICLASGTTYTAPATDTWQNGNFLGAPGMSNFAGQAVNSVFQVGFVQHEPGPLCTTLQDKPFSQNYDECLRYYQKSWDYTASIGSVGTNGVRGFAALGALTTANGINTFGKSMAKLPTITLYNHSTGAANSVQDNGAINHASATANLIGMTGFSQIAFATATTAMMPVWCHYTADVGW